MHSRTELKFYFTTYEAKVTWDKITTVYQDNFSTEIQVVNPDIIIAKTSGPGLGTRRSLAGCKEKL
jgi:hypothetical protein